MPAVPITVNTLTNWGGVGSDLTTTAGDATNDHTLENNGRTLLLVYNGDVGAHTITITGVASPTNYGSAPTISSSIGAGEIWLFGPFNPAAYNNSSGVVAIGLTTATSIQLAGLLLPQRYEEGQM